MPPTTNRSGSGLRRILVAARSRVSSSSSTRRCVVFSSRPNMLAANARNSCGYS
jgi:hypothetical protein